jgi:hypothetical protein
MALYPLSHSLTRTRACSLDTTSSCREATSAWSSWVRAAWS